MRTFIAATFMTMLTIVFGGGFGAVSQASAQEGELGGTIRSIIVEGNQRIEARTVESYLLVEPGDSFDGERLDLSLKTLFATGLFADVSLDRRESDLLVRVVENPIINRVLFEGNNALDDDKLREEVQAAPRGIFTAARVQADVQRILELYRQSGRFAANVEPQYKPLDQNRVDLIFTIEDGPVTGVRAINFIGNDVYSDRRLRSEIVTRQSRLWRFFSSNDNYDPSRLEFDRELLRQFYQNNGYYDFRVISAVADLTPDQEDFYITFTIDEGDQYEFGEVSVETALEKLNDDALASLVPIRPGELYQGDLIESSIDTLTFAAGVAGYAFVDIRPRLDADPETNTVNVTFAIDEGPRVYVERINIEGNTQTLDRVVRRELRISEGDAFNRVLLDRSRNRVRALGFFKDVTITETPGSEPDRTVVDVTVEEQPTGELSFAAGFSSTDSFLLDLSVSQRNLRGRGQSVVARVSASQRQQIVDLRFTEPRFLDRNLSAGIDVFANASDFSDIQFGGFETETIGAGVRVGFPLSESTSLGLRYRLQQDDINVNDQNIVIDGDGQLLLPSNESPTEPTIDDITDPDNQFLVDICDPRFVFRSTTCRSERKEISSIVGYTFRWDRRNDPIAPTRGFDFSLSQDVAGLGGDVQYFRTDLTASTYRGIMKGVRASLRLSAGAIEPWGNDDGIRINNRFFKGGNSFRGFDVAGLGPREVIRAINPNTGEVLTRRQRALGGNVYYIGTAELTIPNFLPEEYGINSALFIEAGSVGQLKDVDVDDPLDLTEIFVVDGVNTVLPAVRLSKTAASLRASAGISIFWDSPFGPIRFDFSHILRREDYDRTETFRFSTSTRF
ncbi:MAG: outer membrane protein assembly factor BamA [Pseudomonadota bacterium]